MIIETSRILERDKIIKFAVSIFGDGPLRNNLKNMIERYKLSHVVHLHGHHADILPIISALDVFVLSSHNEGLPMSLIEAMSVGTIPVCTKVGGIQEVIHDGVDGYLVKPNNYEQMAAVLKSIALDSEKKREIMKMNAREKIMKDYSIQKSTSMLDSLYESLV